jgi:hypothetical protein
MEQEHLVTVGFLWFICGILTGLLLMFKLTPAGDRHELSIPRERKEEEEQALDVTFEPHPARH